MHSRTNKQRAGKARRVDRPVTPLQIALDCIARGWNPVRVSLKTKKPFDIAWQNQPIKTAKTAPRYFNGSAINVGVQLGNKSNGLTHVDLDCAEAVIIGGMMLPKTSAVFGRKSKQRSHFLYYTTLADEIEKANIKFHDTPPPPDFTKNGPVMLELRIGGKGKGAQSVFPGSVHESGETIEWAANGEPAKVAGGDLTRIVERIAAAALLARYWPAEGARHDVALTIGGFLARAGLDENDVAMMLTAIAKAAKDNQIADRAQAGRDAFKEFRDGKKTRGYPALERDFGAAVASKVAEWLHYDDGSADKFDEETEQENKQDPPVLPQHTLDQVHAVFRKWFGDEYDLDALDATLAAAASEQLDGDPLWLLVISGAGAAKTETVSALMGAGAHVTSTIASEGALLSASSRKQRAKTATGGLLRKIGDRGLLVIKDVTSILSADRNTRASVLAALREIYDGRWERNVGTDGGQTLTWIGRIVVIGAVTTAWDVHHAVIATMGDRFVLIRIDSNIGRERASHRAIRNTGSETQMRDELAAAVGGLIDHIATDVAPLSDDEIEQVVKISNIVTLARTPVERDYRGDVSLAHAPEMPTRFAKQLAQIVRGGIAIGVSRAQAMRLAKRCARDSIPPLRLDILLDVAANPGSRPGEVRRRINKPWSTTKREMEALQMLSLLQCDEEKEVDADANGNPVGKTTWLYYPDPGFDFGTLTGMVVEIDPAERWRAQGLGKGGFR